MGLHLRRWLVADERTVLPYPRHASSVRVLGLGTTGSSLVSTEEGPLMAIELRKVYEDPNDWRVDAWMVDDEPSVGEVIEWLQERGAINYHPRS